MKSHTIKFMPSGREAICKAGHTLLDCARDNGIAVSSVCGGKGKCRSCKVRIEKGVLTAPTSNELKRLSNSELERGWRLSCQAKPAGDLVVYIPAGNSLTSTPAFKEELIVKIIPDAGGRRPRKGYGVAIDLGTTKIAGYLVNLCDGSILSKHAMANPQDVYGDDVISRVTYAMSPPANAKRLEKSATGAIDDMMLFLSAGAGCQPVAIAKVAICGNTAMHHLVLGLPVDQLARAPYLPWVKDAVNISAKELGLKSAPGADVYFLPNIGGYVGGDHVAVLAATGALNIKVPTLIVDIGTNTEISLADAGNITSVSCASGPAFEGGHIKHGIKASPGAIDKIIIRDGKVKYRTIGGGRPEGICGSGMLDAVAQMVDNGIIDSSGRMDKGHPLIHTQAGQSAILIAGRDRSVDGEDIVITQGDIRELQLAKAAIRTGIDVLLKSADIAAPDVKRIIIAGTFGNYIDIKSAIRVGMLPDLPARRFSQVGNAAGAGTEDFDRYCPQPWDIKLQQPMHDREALHGNW
ncbi:MAG: ASKHA domain-containing protein [Chloroflexi bacterium]|nr:ASKHA domain-containing protein [Chloroflexota bacterium]